MGIYVHHMHAYMSVYIMYTVYIDMHIYIDLQ